MDEQERSKYNLYLYIQQESNVHRSSSLSSPPASQHLINNLDFNSFPPFCCQMKLTYTGDGSSGICSVLLAHTPPATTGGHVKPSIA